MKDQEKPAPKRRELVGRNAFPPFKRNQIRWALHCYRWKHGISWEKYPYEIAHALGIRELGDGLNSRDPRGFVLENQTPTPEKLRLYERFIEKAAPEYARAFTEDGFISTFSDVVARFMNPDRQKVDFAPALVESASALEKLVYLGPYPTTPGFRNSLGHKITAFRRIGETPYLYFISLMIDTVPHYAEWDESYTPTGTDPDERNSYREYVLYRKVLELNFDDSMSILEFARGVAVPLSDGRCYVVAIKSPANVPQIAQFSPCEGRITSFRLPWKIVRSYRMADSDTRFLHIMLLHNNDDDNFQPSLDEMLMMGHVHEPAQNFISTMKLGF